VPCLIHVEEVTQPQGHSTSGSHERYKSTVSDWIRDKDGSPLEEVPLLDWYKVYDCNVKFREWILHFRPGGRAIATAEELDAIEKQGQGRCAPSAEGRLGRIPERRSSRNAMEALAP
jgi:2-oxoisovalerate dehydrogenase E1 component